MHPTLFLVQTIHKIDELKQVACEKDTIILLSDAVMTTAIDFPNTYALQTEKDLMICSDIQIINYLQLTQLILQHQKCVTLK